MMTAPAENEPRRLPHQPAGEVAACNTWLARRLMLRTRMRGPGGCYNVGNVLALGAGLTAQLVAVSQARGEAPVAALEAVRAYRFGSPGATALTAAIVIFFVSGEAYHRA